MNKIFILSIALSGTLLATGCVSKEQIAANKADAEFRKQGKDFVLQDCGETGKACLERARSGCAALGQEFGGMYSFRGRPAGEFKVTCEPVRKAKV